MNFITIASPHMGSRRPSRGLLNPIIEFITRNMFYRTGKQLMLEDKDDSIPLLVKMSHKDKCWYQALDLFSQKMLYSNIQHDIQVRYCTSAIVHKNPYLVNMERIEVDKKFSHIALKPPMEVTLTENDFFRNDEKKEFLLEMLNNLQTLSWKRCDILLSGIFSHENIVMKRPWFNKDGNDVVEHISALFENLLPLN